MGALTEQHLLRAAVVLSRGEAMCDLSDWPEKKRREASGSRVKRGLWRDGESVMGLTEARVQRKTNDMPPYGGWCRHTLQGEHSHSKGEERIQACTTRVRASGSVFNKAARA